MTDKDRAAKIAQLNDQFRKAGVGGRVMITASVNARGIAFTSAAISAVREYDRFDPDNDPWHERDFGSFEVDGQKLFWKIDCYDKDYRYGSEDPCDPANTKTVPANINGNPDTVSDWLAIYDGENPAHCRALHDNYGKWYEQQEHPALSRYSFYARLTELGARKFRDGVMAAPV